MNQFRDFESKKEVMDWLDAMPDIERNDFDSGTIWWPRGTYLLRHGEYTSPEYRVRRYKTGWGIHRTVFYHTGTYTEERDGRTDEFDYCDQLVEIEG